MIGYEKARVTPYLHILVYHAPRFLKQNTGLKPFTGQGIEKINDIVRSIYHNKSNRHDACKEAILALKRINHLQEYERVPHEYNKTDQDYWTKDIFVQRRKRPRLCVYPRQNEPENEIDVDTMRIIDVKDKLKELNIQTKLRKSDKLNQRLKDVLNATS